MERFDSMNAIPELAWRAGRKEDGGAGLSKAEQIYREFKEHEDEEGRALEGYRDAIARTENPVVKFLLNTIRLDEEKHRDMLNLMSSTFQRDLFWTREEVGLDVFKKIGPEREQLVMLVDKFLQVEEQGIKEFKTLLSDTEDLYEGVFSLLLRALIRDSEKHLMLLKFLRNFLKKHTE